MILAGKKIEEARADRIDAAVAEARLAFACAMVRCVGDGLVVHVSLDSLLGVLGRVVGALMLGAGLLARLMAATPGASYREGSIATEATRRSQTNPS